MKFCINWCNNGLITPPLIGAQSAAINISVCMCLSIREHISKTRRPNYTKYYIIPYTCCPWFCFSPPLMTTVDVHGGVPTLTVWPLVNCGCWVMGGSPYCRTCATPNLLYGRQGLRWSDSFRHVFFRTHRGISDSIASFTLGFLLSDSKLPMSGSGFFEWCPQLFRGRTATDWIASEDGFNNTYRNATFISVYWLTLLWKCRL